MRQRHRRHTLYLGHLQHPQVGAPWVKPIQRVVVGAEARRTRAPSNRMVEHTAQGPAIHGSSMDAKADDPPRALVHHDQHPMASQDRRLAPEQVDAPQAIFRMPQERQPGRTTRVGCRSRVRSEHSGAPRPCRCRPQRRARSVVRSADSPTWGCAASCRRWHRPVLWTVLGGRCDGAWVKTASGTCGCAEPDGTPGSSTVSARSLSESPGPGA